MGNRSSDDVGAVDVDNHLPLHIIIKEKKKLKQKIHRNSVFKGEQLATERVAASYRTGSS